MKNISIHTLSMTVLLVALIGFGIYSEIRQHNRISAHDQADQVSEPQATGTPDARPAESAEQPTGLSKMDAELLNEAGWGHADRVKALLDGGANVNVSDANGDTPLIEAASLGSSETVKLLLERGGNVNAQNLVGNTALIEAVAADQFETAKLLLAAGANVNVKNIAGATALEEAQRGNHPEMVQLLRVGSSKSPAYPAPRAALEGNLQQAVVEGDVNKISSLIAAGADVNARNQQGWTALMQAAFRGNNAIVRLLLAAKADPNIKDSKLGRTALILATMQGQADVVQTLLAAGANPDAQDHTGNTPMSIVQQTGQVRIGRLLKQAGAKAPAYNQIIPQP